MFRPKRATVEDMASPANPFSDPLRFERRVPECAIVIFGANGDLTKRKLLPALYRLAHDRRLPESFAIIGNSRTAMSDEAFRERMRVSVQEFSEDTEFDPDLWDRLSRNLHYIAGDLQDSALYTKLASKIAETNQRNVLFSFDSRATATRRHAPGSAGLHREAHNGASLWKNRSGTILERALNAPCRVFRSARPTHRSLPGQGNRPEYIRLPFRQRHL
jgi:hypothetical protein